MRNRFRGGIFFLARYLLTTNFQKGKTMKNTSKILALVLILMTVLMSLSAIAVSAAKTTEPTVIYLTPNANWKQGILEIAVTGAEGRPECIVLDSYRSYYPTATLWQEDGKLRMPGRSVVLLEWK